MKCPDCGHKQICPCLSCQSVAEGEEKEPWIDGEGGMITCSRCGLTKNGDWWEEEAMRQFREWDEANPRGPLVTVTGWLKEEK